MRLELEFELELDSGRGEHDNHILDDHAQEETQEEAQEGQVDDDVYGRRSGDNDLGSRGSRHGLGAAHHFGCTPAADLDGASHHHDSAYHDHHPADDHDQEQGSRGLLI
jgi:hypothetical protein